MRNFLGRARPAKRRVALQLRVAVGPDIARGGLTNDHLFSVGGEVLDQNGDAATIVVGEPLELELRVSADDTSNSLLLAVVSEGRYYEASGSKSGRAAKVVVDSRTGRFRTDGDDDDD